MQTRQGDRREQMRWDMHWSPEQKVQLQVAGIKKKISHEIMWLIEKKSYQELLLLVDY